MDEIYIFIVLTISLFCDYLIWKHFSMCFEMQYELANNLLAHYERDNVETIHPTVDDYYENNQETLDLLFTTEEE
tara:strand:+ start:2013 stop:2237 length:225 start_codon:yes stop_codon:yes gene_type:complete